MKKFITASINASYAIANGSVEAIAANTINRSGNRKIQNMPPGYLRYGENTMSALVSDPCLIISYLSMY